MQVPDKYDYRLMKNGEENYLYDLIVRVFHEQVAPAYSPQGIDTFLNMLSPDFLEKVDNHKFTIVAVGGNQPHWSINNY